MKKRIMALLLSLVMALSLVPTTVWAAGASTEVADDGISVQALNTGHKIDVTFTVLYVGDEFRIGYNYGTSEKTQFVCQYSQPHSDTAYTNHTILISDIKAAAGRASVNSGYQIVGWSKESNANPTIWELNKSGTTACNKGTTIYLVAKNPNPQVEFKLNYNGNAAGVSNVPASQTAKSSAASVEFTISSQKPTRDGYDFLGWSTASNATTATYQPSGKITVTKDTNPTTLYAVWKENTPPTPDKPTAPGEGDLSKLIGDITVNCTNENASHTPKSKGYALISGSYTTSEVEGDAENGYTYTVTINSQKYVDQFDTDTGASHDPKGVTATVTLKHTNNGWTVMSGTPVVFNVACVTEVTPPEGPGAEDLAKLEAPVEVVCTTKPETHTAASFALIEGTYTVGNVAGNETDGYTCDITITADEYVTRYNTDFGKHTLTGDSSKTLTLKYVEGRWISEETVTFNVECETEPPAGGPSDEEVKAALGNVTVTCLNPAAAPGSNCTDCPWPAWAGNSVGKPVKVTDTQYTVAIGAAAFANSYTKRAGVQHDLYSKDTLTWVLNYDAANSKWVGTPQVKDEDDRIFVTHEPTTVKEINVIAKGTGIDATCTTSGRNANYGLNTAFVYYDTDVNTTYNKTAKAYVSVIKTDKYADAIAKDCNKDLPTDRDHKLSPDKATVTWKLAVDNVSVENGKVSATWKAEPATTADASITVIHQFVVTFKPDNGEADFTQNAYNGEYITRPANPEKEGYVFKGWFADGATEAFNFATTTITGDITLTAKWEKLQTVKVVIYRNGDTSKAYKTVALESQPKGHVIDLTKLNIGDYYTANYTGKYDFYGWYNDGTWNNYKKDLANPPAGLEKITVNGWTNIKCMVYDYEKVVYFQTAEALKDYQKDHSKTEGLLFSTIVRKGTELPTADAPTAERDGYTFKHWSREGQSTDVTGQTVGGWTNLYANWEANKLTIVYHGNGGIYTKDGTDHTQVKSYSKTDKEIVIKRNTFTREGYAFVGWTTEKDGTTIAYKGGEKHAFSASEITNGEVHFWAKWKLVTVNAYVIPINSDGDQLIEDNFEMALNNETLKRIGLGAYTADGQHILLGKFDSDTVFALTPDDYFGEENEAELKAAIDELNDKLLSGSALKDKIDWTCLHVAVDDEDDNENFMSGNLKLYSVRFVTKESKDVTGMPEEVYPDHGIGVYDYYLDGETMTMPANPKRTGYDFKGWAVNGKTVDTTNGYTITGDVVFTAQWEARNDTPYTVEYYQQQLDGKYTLVETKNLKGTTDTTANAEEKSYTGFTLDKTVEGTKASGTVTGDGKLVLKLYYTRNSYTVKFDSMGGSKIDDQKVKYQETATKPTDPTKSGYTFAGWYTDKKCTKGNEFSFDTKITGDITLYAKWDVKRTGTNPDAKNPYIKDNTKKDDGKKVESGKTFDAGIAMYVGLSILSVTGSAVVIRKRKDF